MATQDDELVTAEGARKLFDRYRDTAGGGVVLADVVTSGHMTSIPLGDSVRNYRVIDVFISGTDFSQSARIVGAAVIIGQEIQVVNVYGNYSSYSGYQFKSDTTIGMKPGVSYIPDGISLLVIGYNFA